MNAFLSNASPLKTRSARWLIDIGTIPIAAASASQVASNRQNRYGIQSSACGCVHRKIVLHMNTLISWTVIASSYPRIARQDSSSTPKLASVSVFKLKAAPQMSTGITNFVSASAAHSHALVLNIGTLDLAPAAVYLVPAPLRNTSTTNVVDASANLLTATNLE